MGKQTDTTYLSLSAASKLLGVHSTTLRRWADTGAVPVYITPGGHRRFARSDIDNLATNKPFEGEVVDSNTWVTKALAVTRNEITHSHAHGQHRPDWMVGLNEEDRLTWRRIGQQLMGVVLRYINSPNEDEELLREAKNIGSDYARLARRTGVPLTAALEAALFFRDSLVEAAMDMPEESSLRPAESARLLRRMSRVANEVHLAVAASYEQI